MKTESASILPKKRKPTKKSKKFFTTKTKTTLSIIGGILSVIVTLFGLHEAYKKFTTPNISGKWKLKFVVNKCNHKEFVGDSHTQITVFNQTDKAITGKGEKWEYNGKPLSFEMHRKVEYAGTIEGNKLKAIYVLHGRDRDSEGSISVVVEDDGKTIKGTYSGTIGNDSGPVTGEKID